MDWNSLPKVDAGSAVRGFLYFWGVWMFATGIFYVYVGMSGADVFSFLGVDAYLWIGVGHLGWGFLLILAVYFRPRWFGNTTR